MSMTSTGLPGGSQQTAYTGFAGNGGGNGGGDDNAAGRVSMPFVLEYGHGIGMMLVFGGFSLGFAMLL
jgi:hypothetical protein